MRCYTTFKSDLHNPTLTPPNSIHLTISPSSYLVTSPTNTLLNLLSFIEPYSTPHISVTPNTPTLHPPPSAPHHIPHYLTTSMFLIPPPPSTHMPQAQHIDQSSSTSSHTIMYAHAHVCYTYVQPLVLHGDNVVYGIGQYIMTWSRASIITSAYMDNRIHVYSVA